MSDLTADELQSQHRILFKGLALILNEGAAHLRGYVFNHDAQLQAETLERMAEMARTVAEV